MNIDTNKLMSNAILKRYESLQQGIEGGQPDSLDGLFQYVKAAIDGHPEFITKLKREDFDRVLAGFIDRKLFTYKDIGIRDISSLYRETGTKNPSIILMSERVGHYWMLKKMAADFDITYACDGEKPGTLTMEYFSEELKAAGVDFESEIPTILTITGYTPTSFAANTRRMELFKKYTGAKEVQTLSLVDLSLFSDKVVSDSRVKAIRFHKTSGGKPQLIKMHRDDTVKKLEEVHKWWKNLGDQKDRLISKEKVNEKWEYTIWKVDADALPWEDIEQKYQSVMEKLISGE
jgi:hypothetical protein